MRTEPVTATGGDAEMRRVRVSVRLSFGVATVLVKRELAAFTPEAAAKSGGLVRAINRGDDL